MEFVSSVRPLIEERHARLADRVRQFVDAHVAPNEDDESDERDDAAADDTDRESPTDDETVPDTDAGRRPSGAPNPPAGKDPPTTMPSSGEPS